jgi:hypothetical protein
LGQVLIGSGTSAAFNSLGINSGLTAHGILLAQGTNALTATANLTNGQVLIGSTGADPIAATLGAGTGIAIVNGTGSITISATTPASTGPLGQVLIGSGTSAAFNSLGINSGLTAHGVLLAEGTSAVVATAAGSNGAVLIGSTGADPQFASFTSTGNTLAFTAV